MEILNKENYKLLSLNLTNLSCFFSSFKLLLFLYFLLQIAAIALIAVGAYVQIKLTDYYEFFGNQYTGPGILLIVVGVFIFLIAFFGCMGAIKENYCLTMTVRFLFCF